MLRDGKEQGRQAVFNVAGTWIVRIFELHDGFRRPASFLWSVLTQLESLGAAAERIRYHGVIPGTNLQYTVTMFVHGVPLTDERCSDPSVREQLVALQRSLRKISVPDTAGTVKHHMRPRLELLQRRVSVLSADVLEQVGKLACLSDFDDEKFKMVVSHCDLAPENIVGRFESESPSATISVIDWEFCNYVPEFRVEVQLGSESGRLLLGADFLRKSGYGPYPDHVVWTEALCMIAEDYGDEDFEAQVLLALSVR